MYIKCVQLNNVVVVYAFYTSRKTNAIIIIVILGAFFSRALAPMVSLIVLVFVSIFFLVP